MHGVCRPGRHRAQRTGRRGVDIFYLIGPLTTGLFVLKVIEDDEQLRRIIRSVAIWGAMLMGGYGIIQFLILPPWDKAWLVGSAVTNLGNPTPGDFRTFSTLSTTGPLGQVLAALLLIAVAEKRIPRQFLAMGLEVGLPRHDPGPRRLDPACCSGWSCSSSLAAPRSCEWARSSRSSSPD